MSEIVGNYVLDRELGRGGMGIVYAATHRVLGRPAAIKLLRADTLHHREQVERFFNEARAAMAIEHPAIVEVHDVGIAADGRAYIAMELLDGEPLSQRLARGTLPVRTAIDVSRQLAGALEAAHAAGIVHRDLKPANVILCRDGRVKLVDFGIAKLAFAVGAVRTMTGAVLGTPSYMSPEQCAGSREIDARSDLYSLGCVVFAMVTGGPPFQGETGAVIGMHQFVDPPRLRARCPSASAALEAVVDGLLAKAPGARFQNARAVAAALAAPEVVELAASSGGEPTADVRPGGLRTRAAPVAIQAPATPPPHVSAPMTRAEGPPPPRSARRAAWVLGLATIAVAAAALLIWRCNAGGQAPAPVADLLDAAPAPVVDAAADVTAIAAVPVDAPGAIADAVVATAGARGRDARTRRSHKRGAPDAEGSGQDPSVALASVPGPPDAAPPAPAGGDDVALRTFESRQGVRLVFSADGTVRRTGPDLARPVTGTYVRRPRFGEIWVDWDLAPDEVIDRERFRRAGACALERVEWADPSGGRHPDRESYEQTKPACP